MNKNNMKKLQQLVLKYINPKYYNALHIVVAILIATAIHFLVEAIPLTDPIEWYGLMIFKILITLPITWLGGVRWEQMQANDFGAKYSKKDVLRGNLSGVLTIIILSLI